MQPTTVAGEQLGGAVVNWLVHLANAQWDIAGTHILWREVVGNLFGLGSAIGGARRRVWAWPVGIVGNVLLFTVFLGVVFATPQDKDLYGQAGRQVLFIIVSVYGWWRWSATRRGGGAEQAAVRPHWAGPRVWLVLAFAAAAGTAVFAFVFARLGSWGPWPEAWIFVGSFLATYGMARGWTEFWLIWIGVDLVGVPQLLVAGYYPSAVLYVVYAGVVIVGFITWLRAGRADRAGLPEPTSSGRVH